MNQSEPKKYGKKYYAWRRVRAAWIRANPPSHEGQYVCHLCGKSVSIEDMELDHVNPRSGNPESFADFTNLKPSHSYCNQIKGSRHVESKISNAEYEIRDRLKL